MKSSTSYAICLVIWIINMALSAISGKYYEALVCFNSAWLCLVLYGYSKGKIKES